MAVGNIGSLFWRRWTNYSTFVITLQYPKVFGCNILLQLAVEYEDNALFVKVDTDDEYEFAKDMQVHPSWPTF
jgi:hypothetical protein